MRRARRSVTTALLIFGLATATFAGVAAAGELSKKEYKAEINDVCQGAGQELGAALEEIYADVEEGETLTPEQISDAADAALPIFRQLLDDVEEVEGPSRLERKVGKLVDQYREIADEIEEDPALVFGEDAEDPFAKADKQAEKLGLEECVQG